MTYFIDGNQMYATHILMMFAIVIGLYPIETTNSEKKSGGISPTVLQ